MHYMQTTEGTWAEPSALDKAKQSVADTATSVKTSIHNATRPPAGGVAGAAHSVKEKIRDAADTDPTTRVHLAAGNKVVPAVDKAQEMTSVGERIQQAAHNVRFPVIERRADAGPGL